jgi:hypothetical protein
MMFTSKLKTLLAILAFLPGFAIVAQTTTGTITGNISDPSGALISKATVTVENSSTLVTNTTQSNASGEYSFPSLQPGPYKIVVTAPGFRETDSNILLSVDQTAAIDLKLSLGSSSEQVTVSVGAAGSIETQSHEISDTLSAKTIEDLPAPSRLLFSTLQSAANTAGYGNNISSGIGFYGTTQNSLTIGGSQPGTTSYLEDGVNNIAMLTKTANIQPSIEAVQEVNIEQNGASARYQEPSTVNVITKGGTSAFHGRAYDFLKNDAFNAKNYFDTTKTPLRYNQFGANVGGPILKGKLFFFFDFAALREGQSGRTYAEVPTSAERSGNFTGVATIYDPSTYNPATGAISPFHNDTISRISSFAAQFLNYYPLPNGSTVPGTNYSKVVKNTSTYNTYLGRLDYTLGKQDQMSGAYETSNPQQISPTFAAVNLFDGELVQDATDAYVQETHIFNPGLLNIVRFSYNGGNVEATILGGGASDYTAEFGLQGLTPAPNQYAPPSVSLNNYSSLGNPFAPGGATQKLFQIGDEVDITKGKHFIFIGSELDKLDFDGVWTIWSDGQYFFNGQYTSNHAAGTGYAGGSDLADFLLGYPDQSNGGTGVSSADFRQYNVLSYIQDDWRVNPNLTLNLGFRYDYTGSPDALDGRSVVYNLPANTYSRGTWRQNYRDFAPRFGVEQKLDSKSVLRAGYGIYHTSLIYGDIQWIVASPPLFYLQENTFNIDTPTPVQTSLSNNPSTSVEAPFTSTPVMKTPTVQQYNLSIQRALSSDWVATIGYLGNKADHLEIQFNANQAVPDPPGVTTPIQSRRLYSYIGDVSEISDIGYANYNGLELDLHKRFTHGWSLLTNFVYSKAMDIQTASGYNAQNGNDVSADYGPSDINQKYVFKASGVYQLPFGPGHRFLGRKTILNTAVGGWQVSGLVTVGAGTPITINAADLTDTGGVHSTRANQICNSALGSRATRAEWFNTDCYTQPVGTFGDVSRNGLTGPRNTATNASLFKSFALKGSTIFQLRGDFFGLLNHPLPSVPISSQQVGTPAFGQITTIGGSRAIQISAKILF